MPQERRTIAVRVRAGVTIAAITLSVYTIFGPLHLAVVNVSPSMPTGIFVRTADPAGRASIVEFCPPTVVRLWLDSAGRDESHGQWAFGCPDGSTPFLKEVAAVAGDSVIVKRDGVHVNDGPALLGSRPLKAVYDASSHSSRKMMPYPKNRFVLGPGQVWAYTRMWASLDSRYYGPVIPFATEVPLFELSWDPPTEPPKK